MNERESARDRCRTEVDGISIELHTHPAVNLALVHNGVPLVRGLSITNNSDSPVVDMKATVQLHGAGQELSPARTDIVDGSLAPGHEAFWDDYAAVVPTVPHLRELNESYPATIAVTVSRLWGDDIALNVPIRVLAHNEWFNAPEFFDSLAAFVQPNTRAVSNVLDAASELLGNLTGSTSLEGYQRGPQRAAEIAAATYEALRLRQIRYIDPPASFEGTGQKIRTTAQVLDERFGTCIDLAVTYAACLEAAGLRPVIWLVKGHAFAGFMQEEAHLSHSVILESNAIANLFDSGKVVAVEAAYYDSSPEGSFKNAVAHARRHFSQPDDLHGLVAIASARKDGVRPLPTFDEFASPISERTAAGKIQPDLSLPDNLLTKQNSVDTVFDATDASPPRVQKWKRSLLDLSTRNRLLNLKESREVIDLHVPIGGLALLDDLVHADVPIELTPHDELSSIHELQGARQAQDIDDATVLDYLRDRKRIYAVVKHDVYTARLKHLQRTAHTMFEETGNANLYLTFGGLMHATSTGRPARAPLFLLPVKVTGGSGRSPFRIVVDTSGTSTPNYCLVEWLRLKHSVSIPSLETPPLDESGIDIDAALKGIRSAMIEHNLDFRIDETASLAICQFGTFGMWKDLDDHWDLLEQSPIVRHLTHHAGESFRDSRRPDGTEIEAVPVKELDVPVPIPADGSQLRAVALAADGHSFVLEGPPGTGKSQTITNLIAHTLAQGKTVLFVAEKQAALEVVKKRLTKVGLAEFTLDLHGKSQSANAIRAQLKTAIDHSVHYNQRAWSAKLAELRAKHVPLDDYPSKIHTENGVEHTLWTAYDTVLSLGDGPTATIPAPYVASPKVSVRAVTNALQQFERAARSVTINRVNPWTIVGAIDPAASEDSFRSASAQMNSALALVQQTPPALRIIERMRTPAEIEVLLPQARRQSNWMIADPTVVERMQGTQWTTSRTSLLSELTLLQQQCAPLTAVFMPNFIGSGSVEPLIVAAEEVSKGIFGKKKRTEQFIRDVAPALLPGVAIDPDTALPLLRSISSARELTRQTVEHMRTLLGPFAPPVWNPFNADAAQQLQPAFDFIDMSGDYIRAHPGMWRILVESGLVSQQNIDALAAVSQAWLNWKKLLGFSDAEFDRWCDESHWLSAWGRDSEAWRFSIDADAGASVRKWSTMSTFLEPLQTAELNVFAHELLTGAINSSDAEVAFIRGLAVASLNEHRRTQGLTNFNKALKDGETLDYARASAAQREEQIAALPAALLDRRLFKAGALSGEIGQLRRQLDAKRGGTTFRQLMTRYSDHILAATPCFFVSPTSLAQFVPPGSATFDVVVFDEASQVTVPQAIGALGRARSAVIVGDSQQMPPTAIGQVTASDGDDVTEDDEVIPEDLESILTESVESGVPRLWLSWHYRSQDESLIAFSNRKYYEGRLASLPSPGGDATAGVEWRRVPGHFNRETKQLHRTNIVEAEAIVAEIRQRLSNANLASQSIGVVTFNAQQQTLVLDLLEKTGDPLVLDQLRTDKEDGIFVKNLENVQGDERDVILFTTAFSKKQDDSKMPLNFGPLTRTGGEKRLNVAITRARRKVVIFTSFEPSDIDLSRTKSVGMAHLRGYLELAAQPDRSGNASSQPRPQNTSDQIQESICEALRQQGYEVEANYGLSDFVLDIVLREPESECWQVAILLDGPAWAERPTVADRDLTPQLLESMMHWGASVRVWLPNWIDNPESVVQQVKEALTRSKLRMAERQAQIDAAALAQAEAIAAAALAELEVSISVDFSADNTRWLKSDEPDHPAEVSDEPVLIGRMAAADTPPASPVARDWDGRGTTYLEAPTTTLGPRGDLDRVDSPSVQQTILSAVRETVNIEGPISMDRLARDVGRRFGLDRVSAGKRETIVRCIPAELIKKSGLGDFVWPKELNPIGWRGYRTTPAEITRSLMDIAPEEIVNAMMAVCGSKSDVDSLHRRTLAVFNQKRLTTPTRERLDACIHLGLQSGQLIKIDEHYRAGS